MSKIDMVRTALAVAVVTAMTAGAMSTSADAKGGRNFGRHHGGGIKISIGGGFKHHKSFAFHKFGGYGTGCGYWKFGKWFPCTVSSSY